MVWQDKRVEANNVGAHEAMVDENEKSSKLKVEDQESEFRSVL